MDLSLPQTVSCETWCAPIVGSLYEVGHGKWTVEDFRVGFSKKSGAMGTSAPAHGLCLSNVTYNNLAHVSGRRKAFDFKLFLKVMACRAL